MTPELDIHFAVADLLRKTANPAWEWTHFPAGEKREIQTGKRLWRMGLKPGWPDFILVDENGRLYLLEIKSLAGMLTEEQFALFERMRKRGITCAVARSGDEAIAILTKWGAIRINRKGQAA